MQLQKVLSIEENSEVVREIERGGGGGVKKQADVCQEFGLENSMIQIIWENNQNY
jgi:hypothetical protein